MKKKEVEDIRKNYLLIVEIKKITIDFLFDFAEKDLNIYGHIRKKTKECFEMQKVKFPEDFEKLLKK